MNHRLSFFHANPLPPLKLRKICRKDLVNNYNKKYVLRVTYQEYKKSLGIFYEIFSS